MRLADTGPVAAGFWRLSLALPFLWLLARAAGQPVRWPGWWLAIAIAGAAAFFAADLGAWHAGIRLTKLGNATLFGNAGSFVFVAWGLWLVRSWPKGVQAVALALAGAGAALLMSGSYELSQRTGPMLYRTFWILTPGMCSNLRSCRRPCSSSPKSPALRLSTKSLA